jgi:hypothetical protein
MLCCARFSPSLFPQRSIRGDDWEKDKSYGYPAFQWFGAMIVFSVDHSLSSAAVRPVNQSKPGLLADIQDRAGQAKLRFPPRWVSSAACRRVLDLQDLGIQ